jgi:hypothetical protein
MLDIWVILISLIISLIRMTSKMIKTINKISPPSCEVCDSDSATKCKVDFEFMYLCHFCMAGLTEYRSILDNDD